MRTRARRSEAARVRSWLTATEALVSLASYSWECPALPTGTVTLLFTDIEGSTQLLHELGDGYAEVVAEYRRLLREAFTRHGGVEVDTQGDCVLRRLSREHVPLSKLRSKVGLLSPTPRYEFESAYTPANRRSPTTATSGSTSWSRPGSAPSRTGHRSSSPRRRGTSSTGTSVTSATTV